VSQRDEKKHRAEGRKQRDTRDSALGTKDGIGKRGVYKKGSIGEIADWGRHGAWGKGQM
jgi:hypothetical protein